MKRSDFFKTSLGVLGFPFLNSSAYKDINISKGQQDNHHELRDIQVYAPSTIKANEYFTIGVKMLTDPFFAKWSTVWRTGPTVDGPYNKSPRSVKYFENVLPTWKGEIEIGSDSSDLTGPTTFSFKEGKGPYQNDFRPIRRIGKFRFEQSGIKKIIIRDKQSRVIGESNPIWVSEENTEKRLFWGALHCHSILSDGLRSPEELNAFARDEVFLDVFSLTDHTELLSKRQWDYINAVSNDYNKPGHFVSLIGGEWTGVDYGHRSFFYSGCGGKILRRSDPDQNSLEKLFISAKNSGALITANHPASKEWKIDWDNGHDPVERLVEVYSTGGQYEIFDGGEDFTFPESRSTADPEPGSFAIDGLKKGFKLGFIGVGDAHDGRPGDTNPAFQEIENNKELYEAYKSQKKPGLTGIWADNLTRASIFNALWNRHTYATTNNRIILKFMINGMIMGSELKSNGDLKMEIEISSKLRIKEIYIIKNGKTMQVQYSNEVNFKKSLAIKIDRSAWFYLRVVLEKDHFAWSSPIWVDII